MVRTARKRRAGQNSFSFPNDRLRDEYIATIETRAWEEVSDLLRRFLLPSCSLGSDGFTLLGWQAFAKAGYPVRESEFRSRLITYVGAKELGLEAPPPWEGITWVLDLLPHFPRAAISALESYFMAHGLVLPDGRLHGLSDAMEVIRAKCIERPRSPEDAIRLLNEESPRTLEHLVECLYSEIGYKTVLTPRQKDGGFDVLAEKQESGQRALLHIECKKWQGNVGVPVMRGLLGVVSDSKATNGICATTSDLTDPAKEFVKRNPRLDYIPGTTLVQMFNEHLGPFWFNQIDRLVLQSKRKMGNMPSA